MSKVVPKSQKTPEVYHTRECRNIQNVETEPISESDIRRGIRECSICKAANVPEL